jgi:glycosyltransferase involved in cell wall biosynthesis
VNRGAPGRRDQIVIFNWRDRRHPEAGGAEVVCEEIAAGLARRGHQVVLITAASAPNPPTEQRDGYRIVRSGSRLGVYPAALWWLARHRRRIAAVIDSQNGIPSFAPAVLRRATPVILLIHHVHQDQFSAYFPPLAARVARFLESTVTRWIYRDRLITCVSPSTRRDVRVRLGLEGPIRVIPPGAPSPRPRRVPDPRATRPRIVCVGRLVPHKRTSLIVKAVAEASAAVPDLELHIVGDGPDRPALQQLAGELGVTDRVTFHGAVTAEQRDNLMGTAWLTVSASQREGWGLTILEANAFGVPAVAFRRPGLKDAIRHEETGWLVDRDDTLAAAVTEAVLRMRDPAFALSIRARTQAWVARFSWDAMTERFEATIEDERARLGYASDERRARSDLACVAVIPRRIMPTDWEPVLRLSDQIASDEHQFTILFHGADTLSARDALVRTGLGRRLAWHPDIEVRVARPTDLLSLDSPRAGSDRDETYELEERAL